MAGLALRTGASGGVSASYAPMTPTAASTSSGNGFKANTVSQMAYGINGTGATQISNFPAYGAVGVGVAAVAVLVYMWWSLPR